ncbi:MAG: hypothetical protein JW870_19470 [Candidatus Delongbacteria bacterium]|nr:hypothetical protein [Candidatus Delongbacteria bacterium]
MIDELKKSLSAILYERTTSPFYGTLLISWLIWNWKIVYLTVFISESSINTDKINYIISNFNDIHCLLIYPLISTIVLLTVVPFISNGAYWLSLKFNKWKKDKKIAIEMKQLLTLEQSMELREQIAEQEERFEKLLENRNQEIKQLKVIIENLSNVTQPGSGSSTKSKIEQSELNVLLEKFENNPKERILYEKIIQYIQSGYSLSDSNGIDSKLVAFLESYDIIENKGSGKFTLTEKGKSFNRLIMK